MRHWMGISSSALLNGVTWKEEWGYEFLDAFIRRREGRGEKVEKQTSSTEGSGIAIDFAGWKMNNFFFSSLSLCIHVCVDIMDKM